VYKKLIKTKRINQELWLKKNNWILNKRSKINIFPKSYFKNQQYCTTVIEKLKNKTLLNRNLIIHCEITRESTQRSLAFHDEDTRITKENKTKVYAMH